MTAGVVVLRDWSEVGEAIHFLNHQGYRLHRNPMKCWDLQLIAEMLQEVQRDELVVDVGASVLGAVRLLREMSFTRVVGYDLKFSVFDRLIQLRDWGSAVWEKRRPVFPPYRLRERDLLMTGLPAECAGAIIALSVIEHGVDKGHFFSEMARILKPGGRLYVSTDYWEPRLDTSHRRMFGQPWTIFCEREVESLVETAREFGLQVGARTAGDLRCEEAVVRDRDHRYTFVALRFRKT